MIDMVRRVAKPEITEVYIKELNITVSLNEIRMGSSVPSYPHHARRLVRRGQFIRWWLTKVPADYSLHMNKVYCEILEALNQVQMPSYSSFRNVMYVLKRLRLVRPVTTKESKGETSWDRVYYSIVPGNVKSPGWEDPIRYYQKMRKERPGLIPPTGAPACAPGQEPVTIAPPVRPAPVAKKLPARRKKSA